MTECRFKLGQRSDGGVWVELGRKPMPQRGANEYISFDELLYLNRQIGAQQSTGHGQCALGYPLASRFRMAMAQGKS